VLLGELKGLAQLSKDLHFFWGVLVQIADRTFRCRACDRWWW
jgi:hypothetical protein